MALNRHEIMGRTVRDPELTPRKNSDSSDRVNFTVAVEDDFGDETQFYDCVAFGKRAEVIHKYFHKGDGIYVEGRGSLKSYTDKEGIKRKSYSIIVSNFQFPPGKANGSTSAPKQEETKAEQWTEQEGDIPF